MSPFPEDSPSLLAGAEKARLIAGVNKTRVLGINGSQIPGVVISRGMGVSNLTGMNVTLLLGSGENLFGVNGLPLALNKYRPLAEAYGDAAELVGTYDN